MSERFHTISWSGTAAHSLCAWCWMLGQESVYLTNQVCGGVYPPANFKLDQLTTRTPWVKGGVSGGPEVHAGTWGYVQEWEAFGTSV